MKTREIFDNIHWIGVNDRETVAFEGLWNIEKEGVAYNAYIINDDKVAVIDTVKAFKANEFLDNIKEVIGDKQVDYLIVNHVEPDHSSGILALRDVYPDMAIYASKKGVEMIGNFFNVCDNVHELAEGETLPLGEHTLQFFMTPMVHWPESMVTYETKTKTLFSMDIFGSFGTVNGGIFDDENDYESYEDNINRYFACIVGKVAGQAERALNKLAPIEIKTICPAHGLVWRSHPEYILNKYTSLAKCEKQEGVVIVYGTMYGNTRDAVEILANELKAQGVRNIKMYDLSRVDISYAIADIWVTKGVVLAAPSYYSKIFPKMAYMLYKLSEVKVKNNKLGFVCNYSWSCGADREFEKFIEETKADVASPMVLIKSGVQAEDQEKLAVLAKDMAQAMQEA